MKRIRSGDHELAVSVPPMTALPPSGTGWPEAGGEPCTATCPICGATCLMKGAHSIHRFNCGHTDHDLAELRERLTEVLGSDRSFKWSVLPPGADDQVQIDLQVVVCIPSGKDPKGHKMAVRLAADDQPMITSVFGIRIEGWPDGPVIVDLLLPEQQDGRPLVLLEKKEPYLPSQYRDVAYLPRRWFRINVAEIRPT